MKMFEIPGFGLIKPDQMQAVNAVLVLLLIPTFQKGIYPLFRRFGFPCRPINRMTVGMLLCGLSFVAAGLLQQKIDRSTQQPRKPEMDRSEILILNGMDGAASVEVSDDVGTVFFTDTLAAGEVSGYQKLPGDVLLSLYVTLPVDGSDAIRIPFEAGAASVHTGVVYLGQDNRPELLLCDDIYPDNGNEAKAETAYLKVVNVRPGGGGISVKSKSDSQWDGIASVGPGKKKTVPWSYLSFKLSSIWITDQRACFADAALPCTAKRHLTFRQAVRMNCHRQSSNCPPHLSQIGQYPDLARAPCTIFLLTYTMDDAPVVFSFRKLFCSGSYHF